MFDLHPGVANLLIWAGVILFGGLIWKFARARKQDADDELATGLRARIDRLKGTGPYSKRRKKS